MEFCPSSVLTSSVSSIIWEVIAWISFKFWLLLPLGHMTKLFFIFEKKKEYFSFSLTWDPIGAKTSK